MALLLFQGDSTRSDCSTLGFVVALHRWKVAVENLVLNEPNEDNLTRSVVVEQLSYFASSVDVVRERSERLEEIRPVWMKGTNRQTGTPEM